jgi:hypothetical protein
MNDKRAMTAMSVACKKKKLLLQPGRKTEKSAVKKVLSVQEPSTEKTD